MILYDKINNILENTKYDICVVDDYSQLQAITPNEKIMGIVLQDYSIYFYDGSSWVSF